MSNAANPYAPPAARVDDPGGANSEAEAIRREHIGHEASVKSVGILYYLAGVLLMLAGFFSLFAPPKPDDGPPVLVMAAVFFVLGVGQLLAGWGVRQLRPWARILGIVLSLLGLLGFPIGTLINAYILYLFLAKKGRRIFAADYEAIVEATPHVKYRTSIVVWIFLALIVVLIVLAFLLPQLAGR